jgi:hypothetical protein
MTSATDYGNQFCLEIALRLVVQETQSFQSEEVDEMISLPKKKPLQVLMLANFNPLS